MPNAEELQSWGLVTVAAMNRALRDAFEKFDIRLVLQAAPDPGYAAVVGPYDGDHVKPLRVACTRELTRILAEDVEQWLARVKTERGLIGILTIDKEPIELMQMPLEG